MNAAAARSLRTVTSLQQKFDRSAAIDKDNISVRASTLAKNLGRQTTTSLGHHTLTNEEVAQVERCTMLLGKNNVAQALATDLISPDPNVRMSFSKLEGTSNFIFHANCVVDASPEEAAAWELEKMSRESRVRQGLKGAIESGTGSVTHKSQVWWLVRDLDLPRFAPREMLLKTVWR